MGVTSAAALWAPQCERSGYFYSVFFLMYFLLLLLLFWLKRHWETFNFDIVSIFFSLVLQHTHRGSATSFSDQGASIHLYITNTLLLWYWFSQYHLLNDIDIVKHKSHNVWQKIMLPIYCSTFHPFWPCQPCLNLCHILSHTMDFWLACNVFCPNLLIISPMADDRLTLVCTFRKCCDRCPMTGK